MKKVFYLFWKIIFLFIKLPNDNKDILFLKFDALGDLFILQNVLKNYNILKLNILLNEKHKPVIDNFFYNQELGEIIYLNKYKFLYNPFYTFFLIKNIKEKFNVINLRSTSLVYLEKLIQTATKSSSYEKNSKVYYSEYKRLRNIFDQNLNSKQVNEQSSKINGDYLVISPFTSDSRRDYPLEKLLKYSKRFNVKIKIVVNPESKLESLKIKKHNVEIIETKSVVDFIDILIKSKHIISNDSSAGHIGLYYNIDTHIFIGGGQPNQFFPYSDNKVDKNLTLIKNIPECSGCNWDCIFPLKKNMFKCIAELNYQ